MTRECDKMCRIPYEVDKDSLKECGIAGISMKDIHEITIGSRRVNVIFVEGNQDQYDEVMNAYSRECKRRDRDRRCMVGNGKGRLIRCPERVRDSVTGDMVANCCKNCSYHYSLDKKNYYTATFTDLSYENGEGEMDMFEPATEHFQGEGERYELLLKHLAKYFYEIDATYYKVIVMAERGFSQKKIGKVIGKDQAYVSRLLKQLKPMVKEFLYEHIYF